MFYFQPFNFHPKKPTSPYDISGSDIFIFVLLNIIGLGLLIGLIAVPAYIVWTQLPK
jgi:hypothetical protein